jgi:DNA binding domain, excisionase family
MNLLKVSQIAAELQVTGACVYGWIKQGKIQSIRLGKLHRVDSEELNRFLARRTHSGSRPQGESR